MTNHVLPAAPSIAYLVSEYPATSHTFILKEVLGLRQLGFRIATASINADNRPLAALTDDERAARDSTYVIKSHGLRGALIAQLWCLRHYPQGYARGLLAALRRSLTNPRTILRNLAHFAEALMIGRWMQREAIQHLHVHFATAGASVASLAKQIFNITLSMTVHGPDEFANVRNEHFHEKVAAADFVVCISHFARSQTMQHSAPEHWKKLDVSRLGVDPGRFAPMPNSPDSDEFLVLCVGRLTPAKGQHLLLDAIAALHNTGEKIRLELAGDGPDRFSLQRHAEALGITTLVKFHGALNHDQVRALYASCDAFVLPSFAEGIPVVLMEAMASGVPCISTRIAGIPELIEDGESGFLASPSSLDELTDRLRQLIHDPVVRNRLATNGRKRVCDAYDLQRNIVGLAQLFQRRLGASS
ncbi:MAG: glycosyltransferase [Pseudohongiella sp.]|nr:glycosyltransferase [Pseudohongiella sp.]